MIRRRKFITLLSGAAAGAACLFAASAQQAALPMIGFLDPNSPGTATGYTTAFLQGLKDGGYAEGRNVRRLRPTSFAARSR